MAGEYPFVTGPYLSAAFFCERILQETDGVKSAIRIVDRINRQVPGPMEMQPFEYDLTLFIRFKSGKARGPMTFQVKMVKPSGETPAPFMAPVLFEGEEDRGVDIVMPMKMKFDQTGMHWFHIILNDITLTRVPFRISYIPQIMQIQPGSNNPSPLA